MNVINIYHKSKDRIYELIFPSDGETSWQFKAEGDYEIYNIETNNIDSFTISGSTITLPYTLVNENYYVVSITKNNPSNEASIILKTRRQENKSTTQSVPSFGSYDGRYIYALEDTTGILYKIDSDLLLASNYLGNGAWSVSPIIATITLPTLPTNFIWNAIGFVKSNNIPKIVCWAGDTTQSNTWYGCFVYVDTNEVFNIEETTSNSATHFGTLTPLYGLPANFIYDFVNEICLFKTKFATNGSVLVGLNLNTNTYVSKGYSTNIEQAISAYRIANYYFNPFLERFITSSTDISLDGRTYNFKQYSNPSTTMGGIFDKDTGYSITLSINNTRPYYIDANGERVAKMPPELGVINNAGLLLVRGNDGINYFSALVGNKAVYFFKLFEPIGFSENPLSILAADQTTWYGGDQCPNNRNGLLIALGGNGEGKKRMYILKPDFDTSTLEERYLDFTNELVCLESTQLRI